MFVILSLTIAIFQMQDQFLNYKQELTHIKKN